MPAEIMSPLMDGVSRCWFSAVHIVGTKNAVSFQLFFFFPPAAALKNVREEKTNDMRLKQIAKSAVVSMAAG